ncbi:nucleoside diphosphate pyrophosphatase [Thiomicrospira aerophila AL3]|uniref:ADP-ribose pyrophosphatase n=1 Tax=Thiomicrospira aerophila AL3 TaxID=717772 RepID=W0DWJ9_9GAMM|nr:NUDIX domain-containing protein [Thiomicrospira aerophila]AHF01226.1 nucleoside diphosphate pyrophosphatase [Thiomicrospira aerophila AL3]
MKYEVTLVNSERVYDGFFHLDRISYSHSLYAGGMSPDITRELFQRGEAVVVLLYDLAAEQLLLVEQCRAGALAHFQDQQAWLLEPVAGMIDPQETALDAAVREVLEEAGVALKPESFQYIGQFFPSPGGSSEILHLFAAPVDIHSLPAFAGNLHEVEDIKLVSLDFVQAKQALEQTRFNVASTWIAVQWFIYQKWGQ